MDTLTPAAITIRPIEYEDIADLDRSGAWKLCRLSMPSHKAVVALDGQGTLVGYCTFDMEERSQEFRVYAMESHQPGAGRAMLDALKMRASSIIADSVLADAQGWWERRGFVQYKPSGGEGTVGHFEWWREDEPLFDELPILPLWPQTTIGRLVRKTEHQQRIRKAMQRMVKPNTLPLVSVPVAFVDAVRAAVMSGQITPDATAILQPFLTGAAHVQREPAYRFVIWYSETLMYFHSLNAPPELVAGLDELMHDPLLDLEERGDL